MLGRTVHMHKSDTAIQYNVSIIITLKSICNQESESPSGAQPPLVTPVTAGWFNLANIVFFKPSSDELVSWASSISPLSRPKAIGAEQATTKSSHA